MKRSKTPEQMHQQWQRIKGYLKKRGKLEYMYVYARYLNRMASYNGESPFWPDGRIYYTERNNAPVPVEIYTAK